MSQENPLRMTIEGSVDGFNIQFFVYDSDLDPDNPEGVGLALPSGIVQHILELQVKKEGVEGFRRASNNASTSSSGAGSGEKWECPVHGSQSVYDAKFGTGLQCTRWVSVDESPEAPSWANPRMANVQGKKRWYCANREIPLK